MDITVLDVPEEDANRVRQMQMSTMEWDESGEADLRKGFRKGKRSKFRGERLLEAFFWRFQGGFSGFLPRECPAGCGGVWDFLFFLVPMQMFPCKCSHANVGPAVRHPKTIVVELLSCCSPPNWVPWKS